MSDLKTLQQEIAGFTIKGAWMRNYFLAEGYKAHFGEPNVIARAYSLSSLFRKSKKFIYQNDKIAGSIRGINEEGFAQADMQRADYIVNSYGFRHFGQNSDHFAPDYEEILSIGIKGLTEKIINSMTTHKNDADYAKKSNSLTAMQITLEGLSEYINSYARKAEQLADSESDIIKKSDFMEISKTCDSVKMNAPKSFREALQLVWLIHSSFVLEGKYAMALGRLDQYLYPFYKKDIEKKILNRAAAKELLSCALCKIIETNDIVNIAIGGLKRDGSDAVNELSYILLEVVGECNIPGPNLSARLSELTPDKFIDECLKLIGTGIGYPALMNDKANVNALAREGYSIEDCRDYCMVGCIENFIPGRQPPWSDGRFNAPKYIELALNEGIDLLNGVNLGVKTPPCCSFKTFDDFLKALELQLKFAISEYIQMFNNENDRINANNYSQPYLSCFTRDCISRGCDVNEGGAMYKSVHGAACMGIATFSDSLAAIEEIVYNRNEFGIEKLLEMLRVDFNGYEVERAMLISAPKYGNDDIRADKFAVYYVDILHELFSKYKTRDGGSFYTLMASNITNIYAGEEIAATPDGRKAKSPLSDAGSPMRGMDKNGTTALVNSVCRPDYTKVSGGSVINLKFSPSMFNEEDKRKKLLSLVKTFIEKGGQEMQINSVSREMLKDAQEHPENYSDLVVRVSGFSAYYIYLDKKVQQDILDRTEQG